MNTPPDEFDNSVEAQLARLQPRVAVGGLRDATLGRVQREFVRRVGIVDSGAWRRCCLWWESA